MKQKNKNEIIKFIKDNRKNSFIFDAAINGMEHYKLPLDTIIKHILIYQFNLLETQKEILETLNEKN